jgi:Lectin C-type domain
MALASRLMPMLSGGSLHNMVRIAVMLLFCMLCGHPLWAAEGLPKSAPIYNPSSKSYFQLFNDNVNSNWEKARLRATTKVYKGIHGRLAVVDSMETHKFILQNFGLNWREASVWIGLRYWCSVRMLQWEDGLPYSPSDANHFKIWHSRWARNDSDACYSAKSRKTGFAPIYYRNIGGTVRWQAVGAAKFFSTYLVEYVTNGE